MLPTSRDCLRPSFPSRTIKRCAIEHEEATLIGRQTNASGRLGPNACLRRVPEAEPNRLGCVKVTQGLTHRSNRHIIVFVQNLIYSSL